MQSFYRVLRVASVMLALTTLASRLYAVPVLIVEGATSTVGNAFTGPHAGSGTHFHSVTDPHVLPPSNPDLFVFGAAEVGGFFGDEELQGVSEFTLQAGAASSAMLLFDVRDNSDIDILHPIGGLFGQEPIAGFIDVYSYEADHVESVSDFVAVADRPTDPPLFSIEVAPGLIAAGDTISVDVTTVYNTFVADNESALGIRLLARDRDPHAGAITFNNFRLRLSNTTGVPEPSPTLALGVVCLVLSGVSRYRRRLIRA